MLFKFNSFRSNQNANQTNADPSIDASNVPLENSEEAIVNDTTVNVPMMSKLFKRNSSSYAGPETMYENEAWAPGRSVGLFHKRWAVPEEQSSSTTGVQ